MSQIRPRLTISHIVPAFEYSKSDVAEVFCVSHYTVNRWAQKGFITFNQSHPGKSGSHLRFTGQQINDFHTFTKSSTDVTVWTDLKAKQRYLAKRRVIHNATREAFRKSARAAKVAKNHDRRFSIPGNTIRSMDGASSAVELIRENATPNFWSPKRVQKFYSKSHGISLTYAQSVRLSHVTRCHQIGVSYVGNGQRLPAELRLKKPREMKSYESPQS